MGRKFNWNSFSPRSTPRPMRPGVCQYSAWAAKRLSMPIELLHVVQRQDAVAARRDLSGAIGPGVKATCFMEETACGYRKKAAAAEIRERGRVLLAAGQRDHTRGGGVGG